MALAQANSCARLFESIGATAEIVPIRTSGDKGDRNLLGAFVRDIESALLDETIDVALHCLKDLPTTLVEGLDLAAYLPREDARDALISRYSQLSELPAGAMVGTGSLRRTAQLARMRPDISFKPLVGNIDTRLSKAMAGEYDAIVLAIAGPKRLGLDVNWDESPYSELTITPFALDVVLPAPGQAALVLQVRTGDASVSRIVSKLEDPDTKTACQAERSFLAAFGGGCSVPVGAWATIDGRDIHLAGRVGSPDGLRQVDGAATGSDPEALGADLAKSMDAFDIVDAVLAAKATS